MTAQAQRRWGLLYVSEKCGVVPYAAQGPYVHVPQVPSHHTNIINAKVYQLKLPPSQPSCKTDIQSPVDLPFTGLIHTSPHRQMFVYKYDIKPHSVTMVHDRETEIIIDRDMPTTRMNTLSDNADDIQRQLDNEAKDRMKYGRDSQKNKKHKFHYNEFGSTTIHPDFSLDVSTFEPRALKLKDSWNYKDQQKWHLSYPSCKGRVQSPVDLPFAGLLRTKAMRPMLFSNYDIKPNCMTVVHDGETVSLTGDWGPDRPFISGGAAHSRRYVFHSLAIRRPSEHSVGGLHYPMESQAIHVSGEYGSLEDALNAAKSDKSALLVVANLYKQSDKNHEGLEELVNTMLASSGSMSITPRPLRVFSPPLTAYAAYHGSLTTPPCTEAVLWLIRARALPIARFETVYSLVGPIIIKSGSDDGNSRKSRKTN